MRYLFFFVSIILFSCAGNEYKIGDITIQKISGDERAEGSYLTKDHKGNPVIVWTEGNIDKDDVYLFYSVSEDGGGTFNTPVKIIASKGTRFHAESMNKLVFKKDGTIIAVFEKKIPTPENKYAGAILFTQSFDNGLTWTDPDYLHSDTSSGISRSFFDLSLLPDGEAGALWLDGRHKQEEKGTSVFFSRTSGRDGFQNELQVGETICQCCRTDLYSDSNGNIHAVFRDIINDSIRDMVHCISTDNGKTFSSPVRISADNWIINGCPHTGPDLAANASGLHFTWYTAGGEAGIYYCNSKDNGKSFGQRELVKKEGKHPRIAATEKEVCMIWDEMVKKDSIYYGRVVLQIRGTKEQFQKYVSGRNVSASFPQILVLDKNKVLVSWTQEEEKKTSVVYSVITFRNR
jgi:hypothetical protein